MPKYIRIDLLEMPAWSHPMSSPDEWMEDFKAHLERTLANQGAQARVTIVEEGDEQ